MPGEAIAKQRRPNARPRRSGRRGSQRPTVQKSAPPTKPATAPANTTVSVPRTRRPEAAMDVGHLARHQAAHEHVARRSHGASEPEEFLPPTIPPPAPARAPAQGGFKQARHRATRGLEHDAVLSDEAEGLAGSHSPRARTRALPAGRANHR